VIPVCSINLCHPLLKSLSCMVHSLLYSTHPHTYAAILQSTSTILLILVLKILRIRVVRQHCLLSLHILTHRSCIFTMTPTTFLHLLSPQPSLFKSLKLNRHLKYLCKICSLLLCRVSDIGNLKK